MVKRMLIDGTHSEETRVVVMNGTRLEDFDVETSTKKQIKGNVYLAKVIRVEPSLQAAFVDYGGNRHGFLAFSEIHPDYYQIPVADREKLMAEDDDHHHDDHDLHHEAEAEVSHTTTEETSTPEATSTEIAPEQVTEASETADVACAEENTPKPEVAAEATSAPALDEPTHAMAEVADDGTAIVAEMTDITLVDTPPVSETVAGAETAPHSEGETDETPAAVAASETAEDKAPEAEPVVEHLGGEDPVEHQSSRRSKPYRQYKIQEVIKRKQILLVQVVKEERGNKGAALTTYLSLAGRYCVLMPNTPRGGGVSRKITNVADRRRLKDMMGGLDIPKGMAVIVRTAGSERSKTEIKRDYEYLLRTWSGIRSLTMASRAPALVYEEATLIKRAIRDVYSRDIDEILVEGEEGYRVAKDFMKALTPSHAKKVQPYKDSNHMPLFHRYQVENQLEALHNTEVHLKSGGYIVMQQTEALVSIDVNSGRSTRERNIEETALKTNLEAADEIARQLRLRDLAGLVVIDYIDMEEPKNNAAVERRTKDALRSDRARIQVGRISPFGLMELSRQRLRPSFMESSYITCPHCKGEGVIRSTESEVIRILRVIEEEGVRRRSAEITVTVPTNIALYLLNQKRHALGEIEARYGFQVTISGSETMGLGELTLDRTRALTKAESDALMPAITIEHPEPEVIENTQDDEAPATDEKSKASGDDDEDSDANKKKRRRRKRRGKRGDDSDTSPIQLELNENGTVSITDDEDTSIDKSLLPHGLDSDDDESQQPKKSRRRGRRGGRRRNRPHQASDQTVEQINHILSETTTDEKDEDPVLTAFIAEQEAMAASVHEQTDSEDGRRSRRGRKTGRTRRSRKPEKTAETVAETTVTPAENSVAKEAPVDKPEATVIPIVTIDSAPEHSVRQSLIGSETKPTPISDTPTLVEQKEPQAEHVAAIAETTVIAEPAVVEAPAPTEADKAPEKTKEETPAAGPIAVANPRKGWWSR